MKILTTLFLTFILFSCGLRDGDFALQSDDGRYQTSVQNFSFDSLHKFFSTDSMVHLYIQGISLINDCALDTLEWTAYAASDSTVALRLRAFQRNNGLLNCAVSGFKDTVISIEGSYFKSRRRWILQKQESVGQWEATDTAWFMPGSRDFFRDSLRLVASWQEQTEAFFTSMQYNPTKVEGSYKLYCAEDLLQECAMSDSSVINRTHPDFPNPDSLITVYRHLCEVCAEPVVWQDTIVEWKPLVIDSIDSTLFFAVRRFGGCEYLDKQPEILALESDFAVVEWNIYREAAQDCAEKASVTRVFRLNDEKIFTDSLDWERLGIYKP